MSSGLLGTGDSLFGQMLLGQMPAVESELSTWPAPKDSRVGAKSGEQFASSITGGGGSTTTTYKLRARDSSCALSNPSKYVEWTTTTTPLSVASYPGVLPCGGPLVELTVLSIIKT